MTKKPDPTDVSDEEWAFVAPYVTLMTEEAPQGEPSLPEVFNGLRWIVRAGSGWRFMGFVLLPRRWVVERSFGWMSRFRRLARNYERLGEPLIGFHLIAFVMLMVGQYLSIGFKTSNTL